MPNPGEFSRQFSSADGQVNHTVVLNESYLDTFALVSVDNFRKVKDNLIFYLAIFFNIQSYLGGQPGNRVQGGEAEQQQLIQLYAVRLHAYRGLCRVLLLSLVEPTTVALVFWLMLFV